MPKKSTTLSLFSKLFVFLFFLHFVRLKENGYLKLVQYNYTYAFQMAEKNQEKYFSQNKPIKWHKIEVPTHQTKTPNQKITTFDYNFPQNGRPIQIINGGPSFELNDEMIQKLFGNRIQNHNQRPKPNVIPQKQNFKPLQPQTRNQNTQGQSGPSGKSWEDRTNKFALQYLNEFRASNRRSNLNWDDQVFKVSVPHTKAMAARGQISHDGFDNRANQLGKCFFVYQSAENVAYFMTGDNVEESKVARKLTDQWINSPGHRRNMLLPDINHVGISIIKVVRNGGNYYYGTQFFVKK